MLVVGVVTKKYGCQYWSTKWVLCKLQYFRKLMIDFQLYFMWIYKNNHKYWMFAVPFTYLNCHSNQTKENMVMKTCKELLGTCIKSKKQHMQTQYIPNQLVKILWTVSPYLALQHVFSMCFLTCRAPLSSHTNV